MYQQPRMSSTAEARHLQHGQRLPHGLYDSRDWDDQAVDDDEVYLAAVEGFLPRETGVAQQSVSQILRFRNARNESVRHDSRLDQNKRSHDDSVPSGVVVLFAGSQTNHGTNTLASNRPQTDGCMSQNVTEHGFSLVNQERGA